MAEEFEFPSDDVDVSDEGDTAPKAEDNKTIKQLREAVERAERRAKAAEKQNEKLSEFQATVQSERRDKALTSTFTEIGLPPEHAELFKRVNPDIEADAITSEAVTAFAAQYKLAASPGDTPDEPESQSEGFTPVITGNATPVKKLDKEGILGFLESGDYAGLTKAVEAGRVQKESLPR